ncbi:MAG: M18 family aminopeptidase [Methylobacter sp.]|nr:MAG: M18 family aminopeptidase [Methylobacter sp.]
MTPHQHANDLLAFVDQSPSPWHAVETIEQRLSNQGFQCLHEDNSWQLDAGGRYYVIRDGSSIVSFVCGTQPLAEQGFKIIGAHTDSPGLRVKPNIPVAMDGMLRLAVEIYGGPILATFTDRDLSLAGRVAYQSDQGTVQSGLLHIQRPLLRLPNLAIHMNRSVNEDGLKLQKQFELPLLMTRITQDQLPGAYFLNLLQETLSIDAGRILSWDLNVFDTQPGSFWGAENEFVADSQLDNLASCHAALSALLDEAVLTSGNTLVCAFFDHEEIGSDSHKGAGGSFLSDVLMRISFSLGLSQQQDLPRALAQSFMISADMAHAYQPNFPNAYDPDHKVFVNQGPVIKINANQRYSTESISCAHFASWCQAAGVAFQKYSHRCDLPCGSTIGPILSARLGIRTVDVGNPLWAMHSIRESAGVYDHFNITKVMKTFFAT